MKPFVLAAILGSALIAGSAFVANEFLGARATSTTPAAGHPAAQQTANKRMVALQVDNMFCASCPYIVRQALENTAGVVSAEVSLRDKRAVVTYDPSKTEVAALIRATSDMGYPSRPIDD